MTYKYQVTDVSYASPTTLLLSMHSVDPDRPLTFQPGQYATISFMRNGRPTPVRCFSIASSPTEQQLLQFAIRIKGSFTRSAALLTQPGEVVTIAGPYGGFVFNAERDHYAVMMAGGIGIVPFISMIRYATRLQLPNELALLYSIHSQDDAPFMEELLYMQQTNPHFHPIFIVGSGPVDKLPVAQTAQGRLNGEMLNGILGGVFAGKTYFLCGPPAFMSGLHKSLLQFDVPQEDIFSEAFNQAGRKQGKLMGLSTKVYVMSAAGLIVGTAVTMVHDHIVPPYKTFGILNKNGQGSGSRAGDIDNDLRGLSGQDFLSGGVFDDGIPDDEQAETNDVEGGEEILVDGGATGDSAVDNSSQSGSGSGTSQSTASGTSPKKSTTSTGTGSSGSTSSSGSTTASGGSSGTTSSGTTAQKPTVNLSASGSSITAGGSVTLTWSATGTSPISCTASGGWSGAKAASGSVTLKPTATATYTLACSNSAGSSSKSVTVTVVAAPVAPATTLSASSMTITQGQSTTLSWSSTGTAPITCSASGGWSGAKAASGSQSVSPTSTTTYTLSCANAAGSNAKSVTITVNPAPVKPTVTFSANRTTITEGESITVSWSASGTAPISCNASGGWSGTKSASGTQTIWPTSSTTLTITCTNAAGSTAKSISVTVNPSSGGS